MQIDLFELIDGFFRGILYFFYNLISTAFTLIRHPFRGPALLYRAHLQPGQKQMGGVTFLFVVLFVGYTLRVARGQSGDLSLVTQMSGALGGSFDPHWWWMMFVGSFASVIIIDALLRLYLLWRMPGPRQKRRRQAVLGRVEYALFPAALIAPPALFTVSTVWHLAGLGSPSLSFLLRSLLIGFGLIFLAVIPAAAQLRTGGRMRPRKAAADRRRAPGRWLTASMARIIGVGAVLAAAVAFGTNITAFSVLRQFSNESRIVVEDLTCHVFEDRPFVDALLTNRSAVSAPLGTPTNGAPPGTSDMHVSLGTMIEDHGNWNAGNGTRQYPLVIGRDPYALPTILRPGETAMVRFWLTRRPEPGPGNADQCLLDGWVRFGPDGNGSHTLSIYGAPGRVVPRTGIVLPPDPPATGNAAAGNGH